MSTLSKVSRSDHHDKAVTKTVSATDIFESADHRSAKVLEVSTTKIKRRAERESSALKGTFFHTFNRKGERELQGQIRGIQDDMVVCRVFSWMPGNDVQMRLLPKSLIFSPDTCKIYEDRDTWLHAAEEYSRAADRRAARR